MYCRTFSTHRSHFELESWRVSYILFGDVWSSYNAETIADAAAMKKVSANPIKCSAWSKITFCIGFETAVNTTDWHLRCHAASLQEGLLTESNFFLPVSWMTAHYLEQTAVFTEDWYHFRVGNTFISVSQKVNKTLSKHLSLERKTKSCQHIVCSIFSVTLFTLVVLYAHSLFVDTSCFTSG